MKPLNYSLVLILSSLVLLFSCQHKAPAPTQQTTKQTSKSNSLTIGNTVLSEYQHPLDIYSVLIPNKWSKEYTDKTQTVRIEKNQTESIEIISIFGNVIMDKNQEMQTLPIDFKKAAEEYIMDNIKYANGFSLIENVNFAGTKAGESGHLIFEYKNEEGDLTRRHTILKNNKTTGFYLHLNCKPENFDEMDAIFRAMDNSLKPLEK